MPGWHALAPLSGLFVKATKSLFYMLRVVFPSLAVYCDVINQCHTEFTQLHQHRVYLHLKCYWCVPLAQKGAPTTHLNLSRGQGYLGSDIPHDDKGSSLLHSDCSMAFPPLWPYLAFRSRHNSGEHHDSSYASSTEAAFVTLVKVPTTQKSQNVCSDHHWSRHRL